MGVDYHAFTEQLVATLTADPRVLGIVALGSMAERGRLLDQFSDHDFFVIANDAEALRATTEWLPDAQRIALWFRETAHGCKVVYDDGHLAEYAVFTPDELQLARVNDYRVLLDRERMEERMAEVAKRRDAPPSRDWLHGMFLAHVLVAAAREQRGEHLSSRWMLAHAVRFLAQILGGGPDDLDPLRRFHHHGLEHATSARDLLAISEREGGDARAIGAIRAAL
jgi:hypothetical protein